MIKEIESNRTYFPNGTLENPEEEHYLGEHYLGDFLPDDRFATLKVDYRHVFVPGHENPIRTNLPAGTKVRLVRVGNPLVPHLIEVLLPSEIDE